MNVLVTDKNRHIRALIARELMADNITFFCSGKGEEISEIIRSSDPPDIVVLDPELFSDEQLAVMLETLSERSETCCIIHEFRDLQINVQEADNIWRVMKSENSIEQLLQLITGKCTKHPVPSKEKR